ARPCLSAGLAFAGHGVEAPDPLSGLNVIGVDEAARAGLSTRDSGQDNILDHERRRSRAVPFLVIGQSRLPENGAWFHGQRHQGCFYVPAQNLVPANCEPAIPLTPPP